MDEETLTYNDFIELLGGDGLQQEWLPNEDIKILPPETPNVLSNDDYSGPYTFEACLIPNGPKTNWVYSHDLNKVFMDMNTLFPIDFKIKERPDFPLFIRATPTFSQPGCAEFLVTRCINHEHPQEPTNKNMNELQRQHILRCTNKYTYYMGNRHNNQRLSLVFPLAELQAGANSVRENFQFVCKNSCPSPGMNRRPIEVIFTLEDHNGQIYGRKVLMVRICSCPKRDKEKEEKDASAPNNTVPRGKKRKIEKPEKKPSTELTDTTSYELNLNIVGKHNVQSVLKYCHDLMAGEILRHPGDDVPFKKCLAEISAKMGNSAIN